MQNGLVTARYFTRALRQLDEHRRANRAPGVAHLGIFLGHTWRDTWIPVSLGRITMRDLRLEEDTLA